MASADLRHEVGEVGSGSSGVATESLLSLCWCSCYICRSSSNFISIFLVHNITMVLYYLLLNWELFLVTGLQFPCNSLCIRVLILSLALSGLKWKDRGWVITHAVLSCYTLKSFF